jgi:hypothetical protein
MLYAFICPDCHKVTIIPEIDGIPVCSGCDSRLDLETVYYPVAGFQLS